MTKSNSDVSYRALVPRELCAGKKTELTLRVYSEDRSDNDNDNDDDNDDDNDEDNDDDEGVF